MSRNLRYLIDSTREELLAFGNRVPVTDGDSLDAGVTSPISKVSITRQLNKACIDLAIVSKFSQTTNNQLLIAGQREYSLPQGMLDLIAVYHPANTGPRLRRTTEAGVNDQTPDWQSITYSDTVYRYFVRGTKEFVLIELPSASAAAQQAKLVYVIPPTDMYALADYPYLLPDLFHDYLPVGAALEICNMDSGNPSAKERQPYLQSKWDNGITALTSFMRDRMGEDLDQPQDYSQPVQPDTPSA